MGDPARAGWEDHRHASGNGQFGIAPPAGKSRGARSQDPGGLASVGGAQCVFRQISLQGISNGVPTGCTVYCLEKPRTWGMHEPSLTYVFIAICALLTKKESR